MDVQRLAAEGLFLEALDTAPEHRTELVSRRAAGNRALEAMVWSLLRAHEASGPLDRLGIALGVDREQPDELIGALVGPYRLLRRIGTGGMGAVYLAERADGQFDHRVAIKLLRTDRASQNLGQRFLNERRILAQLVHRNIALLLDGNVTESGRPYLVMEYVEGAMLLEHCDQKRLGVRDRLRLLLEVAAAVDYAHRRLVIHRDLKPGNTVVTDDGTVKLLDFGIAKLLEPDAPSLPVTATGARLMTPAYASPEQVRGDAVDTASDVYQLGVMMYELLTGKRPHDDGDGSVALAHAIATVDPLPPSQRVAGYSTEAAATPLVTARGTTVNRLTRTLEGDLDQIVLKALRKEPEQRYHTVAEFADDIVRFLEGRPVRARRGTWRYRASRFVGRHRAAVIVAAMLVVSLIGGITATLWQAGRAREQARAAALERDHAKGEAARAEQTAQFLIGMFSAANDGSVRTDTLRLLPVLERAVQRLPDELRGQPQLQAAAQLTAARIYIKLGRLDDARRLADDALRIQQSRPIGSADDGMVEALDVVGSVAWESGDLNTAARAFQESVQRLAHGPIDSTRHHRLAVAFRSLSGVFWRRRSLDSAATTADSATAHFGVAHATEHTDYAELLDLRGAILGAQGRAADAIEPQRMALALRRRLFVAPNADIARSLNNLGTSLSRLGRYDEALQMLNESLSMRRAVYGAENPEVAVSLHNLAATKAAQGARGEAIELYQQAIAMRGRLLGAGHLDVATSRAALGLLHHAAGDVGQALPLLQQALPALVVALSASNPSVLKVRATIGDCLTTMHRYADAEREVVPAVEGLIVAVGRDHAETQRARGFAVRLYQAWGKSTVAQKYQ